MDAEKNYALEHKKGSNYCECITNNNFCNHAQNAEVIFSTDTSYYIMQAIINDLLTNPDRIHLHAMALFDQNDNQIGDPYVEGHVEGHYDLTPEGDIFKLNMQVDGN